MSVVYLRHRIALDATAEQEAYFVKACGVARFAYNWALEGWDRQYQAFKRGESGDRPSANELAKRLNAIKRDQFPWMLEVTKFAPMNAVQNLGRAFQKFFRKIAEAKAAGRRPDYKKLAPKFKKKGIKDRFVTQTDWKEIRFDGRRMNLPFVGWVRTRQELRLSGRPMSITILRVADRWYASVLVEVEHTPPVRENQAVVGVDLGVKALATLSDGTVIEGPKSLGTNLRKLRRLNKSLHRKVLGSANRKKAAMKVARLHARIANVRGDFLHKLTTDLCRRFTVIGVENLNVSGLLRNRRLARAISDVGMHEFKRKLLYKAPMHGATVVEVDRFYPSSKTCSTCGHVLDQLSLSVRRWECPSCGTGHDRDVNAAKNLAKLAAGHAVTACGVPSSGGRHKSDRETRNSEAGI